MSVIYLDPYKLTLKEVKDIIFSYRLEDKLEVLLSELARLEYKGYIRINKPRQHISRNDWIKILDMLQNTLLETKAQEVLEPLPQFLEKNLQKILQKGDFSAFQNFVEVNHNYLPEDLVRDRHNIRFMKWMFARLKENTLVLYRHQIRLGENARPEDLIY